MGPNAEGLYGSYGNDAVHGDGGNDLLVDGAGDDQIGLPGDGSYDEIYCATGKDFVEAGYGDYVAPDRERVERY